MNLGTTSERYGGGHKTSTKGLDKAKNKAQFEAFTKLVRRVEHCQEKFLPPHVRAVMRSVKTMTDNPGLKLQDGSSTKWPAMVVGRNVFLNAHSDRDFVWSLTMIVAGAIPTMDDAVVCYFVFPTLGLAVALRNGDMLLFNPKLTHCVSSRRDHTKNAFCLSFYMDPMLAGAEEVGKHTSEQDRKAQEFIRAKLQLHKKKNNA